MRDTLYELLHAPVANRRQRAVRLAIQVLVLANVAALVVQSVDEYASRYGHFFQTFWMVSSGVFMAEYIARLIACTGDPRYRAPVAGRVRYALTPLAVVDLLAVAPVILPVLFGQDWLIVRMVRVARVFSLLKFGRYSKAMQRLGLAFRRCAHELGITLFVGGIVLVMAASILFHLEHEAQPEAFPHIPGTLWWALVTMTTVGYGDAVPVTVGGRLVGGVVMVLGVGLVALPAGLLASAFTETGSRSRCPHCGEAFLE